MKEVTGFLASGEQDNVLIVDSITPELHMYSRSTEEEPPAGTPLKS